MIRNIMGCLVQIGQGKKPPEWMAEVLAARDRNAAAPTFSPDGLYFLGPRYDPKWGIPDSAPAYDGLAMTNQVPNPNQNLRPDPRSTMSMRP